VKITYPGISSPSVVVIRFLLSVPSTGAATGATLLRSVISSGGLTKAECYYTSGGHLGFRGFNGVTSKFDSGALAFSADGTPMMVSLELSASGANIAWAIRSVTPGAVSVTNPASNTGTVTTAAMGAPSQVVVNPDSAVTDTAVGMIVVQYANEDMVTSGLADAINGHDGELAGNRFTRMCSEVGIGGNLRGTATDTPAMGPQRNGRFMDILQQAEDADQGLLIEARDMLGLYYRTRASLSNQEYPLVLDYAGSVFSEALSPTPDDALTRNDITVTRVNGGSAHLIQASGALSNLSPPAGVGSYPYSLNANVNNDTQPQPLATFLLSKGTVDAARYPAVVLDMRRPAVQSLFASIPGVDGGDHLRIPNMPSYGDVSTVDLLATGFDETLNAYTWRIEFNSVPEAPYETNFLASASSGSAKNSDFEGGAGTWAVTSNCTLANDLTHAFTGSDSLKMTSVAGGTMTAQHCASANFATQMLFVGGGSQVYVSGWFLSAVSARSVAVGVHWYDAAGTTISTVFGTTVADNTSTWKQAVASLTAPSNAAYALAVAEVVSTGAGSEVHYLDNVQLTGNWW
jgi:hypothetical protein